MPRRPSSHAVLVLAATLLLVAVPAVPLVDAGPTHRTTVPVPPSEAPACPDTAPVEGLGPACLRDDGLLNHYGRDGELLGTVHGPDPAPPHAEPNHGPDSSLDGADERPPDCVERSDAPRFYGHVVYAVPVDWTLDGKAHSDATAERVRSLVLRANGLLHATAQDHGTTADYRMLCEGGQLEVSRVILPTPSDQANFGTIVQDLKEQGYDDPTVKYWVWYPDRDACECGGMGHVAGSDSLTLTHPSNGYSGSPMFGVTFGYDSTRIMMHENGHNLGAVQNSAPHSTGSGHCNDGLDIMCYADGGPTEDYSSSVCDWRRWDCGGDDYYDPVPAAGSYLAEHWNLGHPYNRFITGCLEERSRLTAPGDSVHVDVPPACAGHPYALIASPGTVDHSLWVLQRGNMEVCWTQGDTTLRCDIVYSVLWREGRIPADATGATVTLTRGAATELLLRAS